MPSEDFLGSVKRSKEEEYFYKKEKELVEKMRRRAALEEDSRALSGAVGVADEEILRDLRDLGYTVETVQLLYLVPLVQVAWSEGWVTQRERALILQAARLRGIQDGSSAYQRLAEWLRERPTEDFFEKTLRVIRAILQVLPPDERESTKTDLVTYCTRVADASGSLMGFLGTGSKVTREERDLLQHIIAQLEHGR